VIRSFAGLIVRAFVELGVVFFVCAVALCVVAYRIARLTVTPEPDRLDRLAAQLGTLLGRAAVARQAAAAVDPETDPGVGQADFYGEIDWREMII
jgi:hypothetical protein